MAKLKSKSVISSTPTFHEIKKWYETHLHPDANSYDEYDVYEYVYHSGRWASIFQATSSGAQKFFMDAKPESITDIAAITSIYRPGPLSANVDRIYLDAKKGKKFEWGHPIFERVLGQTYNCLIFQEQVMDLAEVVGGFPKDQCDNVRRAIMKRDHSKGDAAQKEALAMEDAFVKGAMNQGVKEETAKKAYQNILFFSGYGFNVAHATAYAIDSYMCAWLLKHYEPQWLTAHLEANSGNDDSRAKAFAEVRSMGYKIVPLDIMHATKSWSVLPGKQLMPSLTSCKGVGETAVEELETLRPFDSIEDLLWDQDGNWRLSKFNKRSLEALIDVEAFTSIDCVGEDKMFKNYRHMHTVLIDNMDQIKKSTKKEPGIGKRRFFELIKEHENVPDYTRSEKINLQIKHFGTVDISTVVPEMILKKLADKNVRTIDEYDGKNLYWFCVMNATPKQTKNGKKYMMLNCVGLAGKLYKIFMWSWDGQLQFNPYSVVAAEIADSSFGYSTSQYRVKKLT